MLSLRGALAAAAVVACACAYAAAQQPVVSVDFTSDVIITDNSGNSQSYRWFCAYNMGNRPRSLLKSDGQAMLWHNCTVPLFETQLTYQPPSKQCTPTIFRGQCCGGASDCFVPCPYDTVFSELQYATQTATCANGAGQMWTTANANTQLSYCMNGNTPINVVMTNNGAQTRIRFSNFNPGKPVDDVFYVPNYCFNMCGNNVNANAVAKPAVPLASPADARARSVANLQRLVQALVH